MKALPRILLFVATTVFFSGVLISAPFAQLVSPFGSDRDKTPMDPEDMDMMKKAMRDALEKYTVGATSAWESQKTGRAGQAVVNKTYERQGMRCAELTHQFTKGPGSTYTAPLCKTADGTWKLAF